VNVTELPEGLHEARAVVDRTLDEALAAFTDIDGTRAPSSLSEAMRYSLLAGGKRLRPLLVLECARACRPDAPAVTVDDTLLLHARHALVAVECVHTYSLIHDDLPALDNDELRRGRKTLHVAFDESTAILAGDALLTDAFAFLADAPTNAAAMVRELARAAGSAGMVGGQLDDMHGEGRALDEGALRSIHVRKTGRLFGAACAMGALAGGAESSTVAALRRYGELLGLAFQIADDVLDVAGDAATRGKASGGDVEVDKSTYVKLCGLDGARALADSTADEAMVCVGTLGDRGERLRAIARYAARRSV
jgi:geranylgeranyl pyrophosphate synthase